jgi:neutral ceramidase
VVEQTARSAEMAAARLAPAAIAWTVADALGVGGNRRDPAGVTDPQCGVLAVRQATGDKLIAVATIYGMHPTVLHEDSKLVSADFPHYTRLCVQEAFGRDVVACWFTGPEGDQSPRHFVNGQTFAEAERLGRRLGVAVTGALEAIAASACEASPALAGKLQAVDLPQRALPSIEAARKQLDEYRGNYEHLKAAGAPRADVRTAECAVFGAESAVGFAERHDEIARWKAANLPVEVQAVRVGSSCLIGLPGEIFSAYGLEIKRRAARRSFVACLVGGDLQGYIVTPEALQAGGYEATNCLFDPRAGGIMVDAAVKLIQEL